MRVSLTRCVAGACALGLLATSLVSAQDKQDKKDKQKQQKQGGNVAQQF